MILEVVYCVFCCTSFLVFSLYELRFTNNPFYAAMVTLSVIKVWGN